MEGRNAIWVVAGPLIAFKVWFTILLLMYAPTRQGIEMIVVTGWPWAVGAAVLIGGPGLAWWRLLRIRARREELRRQEWMGNPPSPADDWINAEPSQWPLWTTGSGVESDS